MNGKQHFNRDDGKQYTHKAVWFEDGTEKSATAYGDSYEFSGPYLVFHGSKGDIIFSPSIKVVIK